MGRGDNDNDNYNPPHPDSDAVALFFYSDPEIPFAFGGKEAMSNVVGYTKLVLAVSIRCYVLVLVHRFWY